MNLTQVFRLVAQFLILLSLSENSIAFSDIERLPEIKLPGYTLDDAKLVGFVDEENKILYVGCSFRSPRLDFPDWDFSCDLLGHQLYEDLRGNHLIDYHDDPEDVFDTTQVAHRKDTLEDVIYRASGAYHDTKNYLKPKSIIQFNFSDWDAFLKWRPKKFDKKRGKKELESLLETGKLP